MAIYLFPLRRSISLFAIVLFACAVYAFPLRAQIRLEHWQTHTSLYNARTADTDSRGILWVGTSGGVYSYDPADGSYTVFHNIDALASLDISAVRIQPQTDAVFIGCSDGMLHIYNDGNWSYIPGIRAKGEDFASVQINDFLFDGERVFIAGDFGITIFHTSTATFGATITNFNGVRNIPVRGLTAWQGRIWAATGAGVFSAPLGAPQFNLPSIWRPEELTGVAGVPSAGVITLHNDTVYVGADNDIWYYTGSSFTRAQTLDTTVTGLVSTPEGLYAADLYTVLRLPDAVLYRRIQRTDPINGLVRLPAPLVGPGALFARSGLNAVAADSLHPLVPNSPNSNLFMDMTVAPDGSVWAATTLNEAAGGFFRLHDGTWTNFTAQQYPVLQSDAYVQISAGAGGDIWASNWGSGLAHLVPQADTFAITLYDTSNSPIKGIFTTPGGTTYEVLGETATDSRGVTWILHHTERKTNDYLIARDAQGTFYTFDRKAGNSEHWYYNYIAIDNAGTKWLGAESGYELLYFNDNGTLDDESDDIWGAVSSSGTSLPGTVVFDLAVDHNGVLWLAGEKGLYAIDNPTAVLSKSRLFTRSVPALSGQTITSIMVDALNQKWLGSNAGVWVINADGTEVLAHLTTDNTPILQNRITSLASDEQTGMIYIGTRAGMSAVRSLSVRPNLDFSELRCFPQPFIPSQDTELRIEGLAERALVKVATIDGVPVRTIDSRGSRAAIWDGRDDRGELVPSGVYLISSFSETSGETAVVKAMILRYE